MRAKKILIAVLAVLVIVIGAAGGAYGYYVSNLLPAEKESEEVTFSIESGDSVENVLTNLEEAGLIRNSFVGKIYVKLSKKHEIKAGDFILDKSWGTKTIMDVLNDSSSAMTEQIYVTIPEGTWAKDIAKIMEENTNVTAEELLALWNDRDYITELADKYFFITPEVLNSEHVYLEGYLFPETYAFLKNTSAKAITARFLDHTEEILSQYTDLMEASSLNIHEVMTLASVVQYEANTEKDMKLIAGVFFNRMKQGMKLQSSVTVCYALYEFDSWTECETNSNIKSKYNTYKYEGLPPGPILNPGETAIHAVLEPTKSKYLYFMADVYGNGKVHYAKTYAEHLANVQKYLY